jgi:5-methylthioadenosine/S-adenosylhomocysteine deaminase
VAILIKNASYLLRDVNRVEKDVDILVEGNKIWKIGKFSPAWLDNPPCLEVIDATGKAVIPGLINAHTHLYQNLLKGRQDDLPLVDWCNQVTFPLCQLITQEQKEKGDEQLGYYWGLLSSLEMLKNGTTTCINLDMTLDTVFQSWVEAGIRGVGAITCADLWIPDTLKEPLPRLQEKILGFVERWHTPKDEEKHIYVMLGPSAPFICSEKLLLWIREQATKRGLNIHIHVAETLYEVDLMQKERGYRPLKYLDEIGFLGPDVSAAHCIHLDAEELELIKKRQVVPVHNPKSNMKLASGIAPIAEMVAMGIDVALGNDGSASNDNQDMFEEMRAAALLQKVARGDAAVISAKDVLRMATEGGALACGIEAGVLDEGKLADLVIVDLNQPHLFPLGNLINTLVYCARGSDVETVIVNGRIVVRNRKVTTLSEEEVLQEAKQVLAAKASF